MLHFCIDLNNEWLCDNVTYGHTEPNVRESFPILYVEKSSVYYHKIYRECSALTDI